MSKAIVDGIIRSSLNRSVKRFDLIARRYSKRNRPHVHTLTLEDFEDLIVDNFTGAMSKIVNNTGFIYERKTQNILKRIAKKVYSSYVDMYNKGLTSKELLANYTGGSITIYQNSLNEVRLKEAFYRLAFPLIKEAFKNQLKGEKATQFERGFRRRTQFIHTGGETAGREAVRILARTVSGESARAGGEGPKSLRASGISEKNLEANIERSLKGVESSVSFSSAKAREAGTNVIINMLQRLDAEWKSSEQQLKNKYKKNIIVTGKIGPSTKNRPGQESTDWANIRPEIELEVAKALGLDSQNFADMAASMAPTEKVGRISSNLVVDAVHMAANGKNVKVKGKKDKVDSPKKSKSSVKSGTKQKNIKGGRSNIKGIARAAIGTAGRKTNKPQNLLKLQALLNAKLPGVVRKNMGAPGLQNRSGRFANSARVTDISTTRQGFPSIGFTYQKAPYEIFEVGSGRTPWANIDRDPRRLIDRSLREIAAELAIGRFYTRRM